MVDYPGHQIDLDQIKVIGSEIRKKQRKVAETIHTRKRKLVLNRQGGYDQPCMDLHIAAFGGGGRSVQTTQYSYILMTLWFPP